MVLRCPHCGTTKATPGECEACHEAQVRYYCENHKPGRWVDAPTCPHCGAIFGEPARPPAVPPRPHPAPPPGPISTPASRRARIPWRPKMDGPWGRRTTPRDDLEHDERAAPRDLFAERLREILGAAYRARRTREMETPVPGGVPIGMALGGCLIRAIYFALLAFVLVLVMSILARCSMLALLGV